MSHSITLTVRIEPDDDQYVARCVELGTSTCGDDFDEALANITEAVSLHLDVLDARGELADALAAAGVAPGPTPRSQGTRDWMFSDVQRMESSVRWAVRG